MESSQKEKFNTTTITTQEAFEIGFAQGIRSFRTRLKDFMDSMWMEDEEECRLRMAHFIEDNKDVT